MWYPKILPNTQLFHSYSALLCVFLCLNVQYASTSDVQLLADDTAVILNNGLVNITFRNNSLVSSLYKNNVDLLENLTAKTFYLDWNGGRGGFNPSEITIVEHNADIVHLRFDQKESPGMLRIENHFIVLKNVSGFYQYVKAFNLNEESIDISEFRTVHRFSHDLMPHISNGKIHGDTPPDLGERPLIQDTTWQLDDGSYWSKYDYCRYIRETPWFGVFGGGFGAWVISASREYHSGGPLKQDLLVHHDSLMANYLTSSHYGTPNHNATPGWSKFFGPWFIYINEGSDEEVLADVAKQAQTQQALWPYSWVADEDYPLDRGSLFGQVNGQTKAAVVLYSSVSEQFDLQTHGYLYSTETDDNGGFNLTHIRPADYRLVAYPLAGHGSENLVETNVTVTADYQVVPTLHLPEPSGILWSIGETNRRSDEFRYSDEPRNFYWQTLPPANLTFIIGQSNIAKDWYYAQTHKGTWDITYNDTPDGQQRILRVAFAAASGSLIFNETVAQIDVSFNGVTLGNFKYENDKSIYRDALQSGNFHAEKVTVNADQVLDGENVVSLTVLGGKFMYDAISLARDE